MKTYGRALRPLWRLEEGARFLNHGSYGACPRSVLEEQERLRLAMESQPDRFFRESIMPRESPTPLREAIAALATFVGSDADGIALVENATAGVQTVLRSMRFEAGDEILVNDHTYRAVRVMVEACCKETGARARTFALPLPATADEIVGRFRGAMTPRVRLAIVDHITSPTALALPLDRIVAELRRRDAKVLVDGAHGVGHVPLDMAALGADWYVSNAHKWLFAPKGTAFLHAAPQVRAMTAPLVASHFLGLGFPRSFDYVGTRDYTGWLALPQALRFFESLDPPAARGYRVGLIERAARELEAIGLRPVASEELGCSMRAFVMPQRRAAESGDAVELVTRLWRDHRIQAMSVVFGERLLLRVSAQVYVEGDDFGALAQALDRDGWPGR